ncbi:DUF2147 domain-containing protein [Mucilaginibacter mali]|uniref:DUF2147 domain-containing protein n=1 Tax=Mucilaginibacter mali TaxID=2740462 RepID=A0A7D4QD81_9SPHI|nr:DUF2147 domain-containing protein [Mucilaginibacter mali]QKJ28712.1 DUF2147 domain-containing protein [Mucilaginibacter mali]
MSIKLSKLTLLFTCLLFPVLLKAQAVSPTEQIIGRWTTVEKNLTVDVYKDNNEFKAKIVWFKNDDETKRMDEWTDKHNPDKSLRDRKIIGLNVVKNLVYDPKSNSWEHGSVYEAKTGRSWDASAYLTRDGLLKVTGYWHFKFIGRTMTFKKIG